MLALLFFLWADPASFEAAFRAGLTALNQNQLSTAQAQLETASRLQPGDPRVWLALAQTYRKLHQDAPSGKAIAKAESLAGNDPVTLHALALFYAETGKYDRAASFETRYAALAPQDVNAPARAAFLLGKAYALQNNHAKAAEQMRQAIALNPYQEDYYFEAARQSLMDANPIVAMRTAEAGKKIFAKSPQLDLVLGIAYYALEEYASAVDSFLNAIRLDPTVEQPYEFIARTIDHAPSRLPEILAAFKALAQNAPDDYLSNYFYGKALLFNGDDDQAETLLRKSVALNGRYWESHLELAKALEQKGELDGSLSEFRKAIELNPKDAAAHYRLGRLYDRLGKPDQAKAEYAIQKRLIDEEESGPFRQQGSANGMQPAHP